MAKFYGSGGRTELSPVKVYDPRGKWSITRRWRCHPDAVAALETELITAGVRFREEEERTPGGYVLVSAEYGAEDTQSTLDALADLWDLVGNDMEQSIWICPKVKAEMDKFFGDSAENVDSAVLADMVRLRTDVEALARGEVVTYDAQNGEQKTLTVPAMLTALTAISNQRGLSIDISVFKALLASLAKGTEAFLISQYVLRRRLILAKNSVIRPDRTNINHVFISTESLKSIEGVPMDLPFDLPDGQWLKKTPTREQVTADKWQIVQEWHHADAWNLLAYNIAS